MAMTLNAEDLAAIAAAVWDEATSGHTSAGTYGKGLGTAIASLTDSLQNIHNHVALIQSYVDTEIASIKAKTDSLTFTTSGKVDVDLSTLATASALATVDTVVDGIASTLASHGAVEWDYVLTSSSGGAPIVGAAVWMTTDEAGAHTVASGKTNAAGTVTFWLDPGTYYAWRHLPGWNFTNPDEETVVAP